MYPTQVLACPRTNAQSELTAQERRLVCRLIAAGPESLCRIKGDPRLSRAAARLLEAYRKEMLDDLRRRIEVREARPGCAKVPRRVEPDRSHPLALAVPA